MPQMSPISWIITFISFLLVLIMVLSTSSSISHKHVNKMSQKKVQKNMKW